MSKQRKYLLVFMVSLFSFSGYTQMLEKNEVTASNFRNYVAFSQPINPLQPNYELLDACLYFAVNEQRQKHHLPVLPFHISLETMAYLHSSAMANFNFFSHFNTYDSTHNSTQERATWVGIINPLVGECIAKISFVDNTPIKLCDEIVKLWMNSKLHKELILSINAKSLGAGLCFNKQADLYATINIQNHRFLVYDSTKQQEKLPFLSWFLN